ncbi:MAG: phosphoribosylglycinamide formyltransferase [SAR202 cluster bacterium]|nr:phosphoribosylglycinamide formyltransferase [SAR202 cluster bacterium]
MSNFPLNLGILASHEGTNLQVILDACNQKAINASVNVVISNNSDSRALKRAKEANVLALHMSTITHLNEHKLDIAITEIMKSNQVNLILLAGYMKKIGPLLLSRYKNRIINSHPSLLPLYSGKGMFGDLVHQSVLENKEEVSGITLHLVDQDYDHGHKIAQKKVKVLPTDNIISLKKRIQFIEHQFWIETLKKISQKEIDLDVIGTKEESFQL